jgi:FAD:protein FMN transferase
VAADGLWVSSAPPAGVTELRGRVMGSDLHVLVVGGTAGHLEIARRRLEDLERRWSRFRPDSELSRLAHAGGAWTRVTPDTWSLLQAMLTAWEHTGGRCDASVRDAVVAAGYDRDFGALATGPDIVEAESSPERVPGLGGVELDTLDRSVCVPAGIGLDPGALGKGLAADLVTEELLTAGALGALVNVGGDLRVTGEPPEGEGWAIELQLQWGRPRRWVLAEGAIATSSSWRRRWLVADQIRHHLIDPSTGRPLADPPATVSVVAAQAWWAEAAATAIAVGGPTWAHGWAPDLGITGIIEDGAGRQHRLPGAARFLT